MCMFNQVHCASLDGFFLEGSDPRSSARNPQNGQSRRTGASIQTSHTARDAIWAPSPGQASSLPSNSPGRQLSQQPNNNISCCCAACRAVLCCTALVCLLQLAAAQFGGMPGMGMPEQPKAHAVKSDVQYIKCQACEALVKQAYRHTKSKREGLRPHQKVRECQLQ